MDFFRASIVAMAVLGTAGVSCGGGNGGGQDVVPDDASAPDTPERQDEQADPPPDRPLDQPPEQEAEETADDPVEDADEAEEAGCAAAGPYGIDHQEPSCLVPYPGSLWTRPLPEDVMLHLAPSSDVIAECTLTDCGIVEPQYYGLSALDNPGPDDWNSFPRYYGNAADPLYLLDDCGPDTGTFIRIPSGACFSQSQDHGIFVWDQTSDRTLGMYRWGESGPMCLPPCSGMTEAEACPTLFSGHCGASSFTSGPAYADGVTRWGFGGDSLGNAPWSLQVRHLELMDGVILHPLIAVTKCTVDNAFPAAGITYECSLLGLPTDNRPPTGALFFLDYQDAEIDAMGLPAWQLPLVRAAARYGIYVSDTSAYEGTGLSLRFEGGGAYELAGTTSPVYDWLRTEGVNSWTMPGGAERFSLPFLAGLPDVVSHIHLADECVARELAGLPDGCP